MKFVEEVFVADRIIADPNPGGPIPYPLPGDPAVDTYGINILHATYREILENAPPANVPLNAADPIKIIQSIPEPYTYNEIQDGAIPTIGWRTSNKIYADQVHRIQAFPYEPALPMILEFIPQLPADQVLDPGIFLSFTIRDSKADLWQVHNQRRPYIAGPRGAIGYTVADALNEIIEQVNNDKRNGVMAYPFDSQVVGRPNLPFGSPDTNAIRFVAAIKRVAPIGGQVLQAVYDFQKRFEVAFEFKTGNDLPLNQILPLERTPFYPIAPPDLNFANHVAFEDPAEPGYPVDPIWYQPTYGSGNQWQVRMHEEKARGYTGDLYRHYQDHEIMHTNRVYASDVMVGRYGAATFYDKIIIEHSHGELRESYSLRKDPILTTIYFEKCLTPYTVVPGVYALYDADGELTGDPPVYSNVPLAGIVNINVFGLYNGMGYFSEVDDFLAAFPALPDPADPNLPVGQIGFAQQLDGQIPGNILSSPPINQLGIPLEVGLLVGNYARTVNAMLQNEPCAGRYDMDPPLETPFIFYGRLAAWIGEQKVVPGTHYNIV